MKTIRARDLTAGMTVLGYSPGPDLPLTRSDMLAAPQYVTNAHDRFCHVHPLSPELQTYARSWRTGTRWRHSHPDAFIAIEETP